MARKILLVFSLALVAGFMAYVHAQDPGRRLLLDNPQEPGILPVSGEDDEAPASRSILRRSTPRSGGLGDRFQSQRKSTKAPSDAPSELSVDVGEVNEGTPTATPAPMPIGGDGPNDAPSVSKRKLNKSAGPTPRAAAPDESYEPANVSSGAPRRTALLPSGTPAVPPTSQPGYGQPNQQFSKSLKNENAGLLSGVSPALRVEMTGPRSIVINRPSTYSVVLINDGEVPASDVQVRVALPPWAAVAATSSTAGVARYVDEGNGQGRFVWAIEQLEGRAQHQLTLQIAAKESRPVDMNVDWICRPVAASTQIEVQQPQLELKLAGSKDALFGENLTYVITLANPGNGDAENVNVKLTSGQGAPELIPVGLIPAGQRKQIEVQLLANQAGNMVLRVQASAEGNLTAEVAEQINVRRANLQLAANGPKLLFAGADGSYQMRVSNVGNATAEDVIATIGLPAGTKVTALTDGGKQTVNGISWRIGTLAANTERLFEVRCELAAAGENQIAIRAVGAGDLSASETVVTHVEALADLKLTINEPKGPRPISEEVVYELTVVNRGTKAAEHVLVVMHFSEGLEPIATDGGQADIIPGQAAFKPITRIEAGQQAVLKVRARSDRPGNHRFRGEVQCAEPETKLLSEGTTRFFGEDGARTPRAAVTPKNNAPSPTPKSEPPAVAARTPVPATPASMSGAAKKR